MSARTRLCGGRRGLPSEENAEDTGLSSAKGLQAQREEPDMRPAVIPAVVATLIVAGALGRDLPDDVVREPLEAAGQGEALAFTHANPVKDIWVTADNQILVELKDDEDTRPNLFDLNGRTLVFTPDGRGGYSRQVRALEWEEEIGEEAQDTVSSGTVILFESFDFPFTGRRWDSFYLGPPGVVTFGAPFTFRSSTVVSPCKKSPTGSFPARPSAPCTDHCDTEPLMSPAGPTRLS